MMLEKQFDANALLINYFEGPDNGPKLLLAHGGTGSWRHMRPYIEKLIPYWHVYAIDARGHGDSGYAESYLLKDYVSDFKSFIQNVFGFGCAFVGISLGAIIGLGIASLHPTLIGVLVAMEPPWYFFSERGLDTNYSQSLVMMRNVLGRENMKDRIEEFRKVYSHLSQKEALRRSKELNKTDPKTLDVVIDGSIMSGFSDENLKAVSIPTLIIQANGAHALTDEEGSRMTDLIPNAELIKFPKVGHSLDIQSPGAIFDVVTNFLERNYRNK